MKLEGRILLAGVSAIAVIGFAASVIGQQHQKNLRQRHVDPVECSEPLRIGDYRDLSVLRSWKLGTASFVNPSLLDSVGIAYKYDLGALLDSAGKSNISVELSKEVSSLARYNGNFYELLSADHINTTDTMISNCNNLFNVEPVYHVVSWNAPRE